MRRLSLKLIGELYHRCVDLSNVIVLNGEDWGMDCFGSGTNRAMANGLFGVVEDWIRGGRVSQLVNRCFSTLERRVSWSVRILR